jgi:hypothetical protein
LGNGGKTLDDDDPAVEELVEKPEVELVGTTCSGRMTNVCVLKEGSNTGVHCWIGCVNGGSISLLVGGGGVVFGYQTNCPGGNMV